MEKYQAYKPAMHKDSEAFTLATLSDQSIQALIDFGKNWLRECSDTAKLDVQILLCSVIDKPISYLLTWPEKKLNDQDCQQYLALLARRHRGEPIAYITGSREFWSLSFLVSPATLIPRPDTEILVEQVLALYDDKKNDNIRCLDLGTGTGAIALSLAFEMPAWQIDAVDYSQEAVTLAEKNQARLKLANVNIFQSNWFDSINSQVQYDVIVSNPPYIDALDEHLSHGDVRFEPKSALVAADNGLADIKYIADHARQYLKEEGRLFFEHGFAQAIAVKNILIELGYSNVHTAVDLSGNDRITWANWMTQT